MMGRIPYLLVYTLIGILLLPPVTWHDNCKSYPSKNGPATPATSSPLPSKIIGLSGGTVNKSKY